MLDTSTGILSVVKILISHNVQFKSSLDSLVFGLSPLRDRVFNSLVPITPPARQTTNAMSPKFFGPSSPYSTSSDTMLCHQIESDIHRNVERDPDTNARHGFTLRFCKKKRKFRID